MGVVPQMDQTPDIFDLIAKAKKIPDIMKGPKASGFHVRPGTVAVCRWIIDGSEAAAVLFHALLELWVEAKNKPVRPYKGKPRRFLFLSGDQLATLAGQNKKTIQNAIIPELRGKHFIRFDQGKLIQTGPKGYMIGINTTAMWEEVYFQLQPVTETTQLADGYTWVKKHIDKAKLPYLFKRLYDDYVHHNGEFSA